MSRFTRPGTMTGENRIQVRGPDPAQHQHGPDPHCAEPGPEHRPPEQEEGLCIHSPARLLSSPIPHPES